MVVFHHQPNGHELEQTPGDGEGQGSLACCSPWGHRVGHHLATEQQWLWYIGVFSPQSKGNEGKKERGNIKNALRIKQSARLLCGGWAGGAQCVRACGRLLPRSAMGTLAPEASPLRGQRLRKGKGLASLQIPHRSEKVPGKQMLIE